MDPMLWSHVESSVGDRSDQITTISAWCVRTVGSQDCEVEHDGNAKEERVHADGAALLLLAPLPSLLRDHACARFESKEGSVKRLPIYHRTTQQTLPSNAVMRVLLPTSASPTTAQETCL
jgi:hypothetical protein